MTDRAADVIVRAAAIADDALDQLVAEFQLPSRARLRAAIRTAAEGYAVTSRSMPLQRRWRDRARDLRAVSSSDLTLI